MTSEHGDRRAFLGGLRARLAGGVPTNPVHVPPDRVDVVPDIVHLDLDPTDLHAAFERAATEMGAVVHRGLTDATLVALVETHRVERAVVTRERDAGAAGERLAALGVHVDEYEPGLAADADLGVTGAVAAVAATGSVVLDSGAAGGRGASLLPPVHLCVVPRARVVATPADVLRPLTGHPDDLPANLVFVTGPSRTGDIEQILTIGVHGPVAVHIALL